MKNISRGIVIKRIPALRFLLSLIIGIITECYLNFPYQYFIISIISALVVIGVISQLKIKFKQTIPQINGSAIIILFISIGGLISYINQDINNPDWIGNQYKIQAINTPLLVTIEEPLINKTKSYKALASVNQMLVNKKWTSVKGKLLLYFKSSSAKPLLNYGSQIIITAALTPIVNAGNPGGFDYKQYCAFHHIAFQCFLSSNDYIICKTTNINPLTSFIFRLRFFALTTLRHYITNNKQTIISEALLIGYREDLSRTIIQTYSNTGVIHIIVISGLHLGMIYALLSWFFGLFSSFKWMKLLQPLFIITLLWCFAFVSGATASITRSATMFTFIALGQLFNKRTHIYNNLCLSALLIFIINPFALWDVGLQLSYAAVISIVMFSVFIKKWFYFKNRLLYCFWNLCSVSISAQIFTLPLILYYFHQIPILFLFTNIIAVPIAALSLYLEILLLPFSFIPFLAKPIGMLVDHLLWLMNSYIENLNSLPFVVLGGIQISILQVFLLYGTSITIASWLLFKKTKWILVAQLFFIGFLMVRCLNFYNKSSQMQIVVYNIGKHAAIDVMEGYNYKFVGDSALKVTSFLQDFHLKPSRILSRVHENNALFTCRLTNNCIFSATKKVLLINKPLNLSVVPVIKETIDAIILSKNIHIKIASLNTYFNCTQYVFDASNSAFSVKEWMDEAKVLKISGYSVANSGAYIIKL